MKKKNLVSIFLAVLIVITMLGGCAKAPGQNVTSETTVGSSTGVTIENKGSAELEPITLKFMCQAWDVTVPMKDWWLWSEYEKRTNVHIEWDVVAQSAMNEKKSTLMASNDLPDAFWQFTAFTPAELAQYGSEGVFISLDDKLDKLPALSNVLKRIPSALPCMTMPDGHIYGFPYINEDPAENSMRYYVNKKLLAQTGLALPNTLEDFEALLKSFKSIKVGDKSVSPFYIYPGSIEWNTESFMMGSFGMGNNGLQQVWSKTYNPGDDNLKFIYTDPKIKEMWQMFARWFKEGYMNPETFTGYDYAKWVADGTAGLVGSYSWPGADILYTNASKDYVAINALKGPYSQVLSWQDSPVRSIVSGIITNKCKYVDRALSWFDYWYSEEGSMFGAFGTEGVTYVKKDGKLSYVDEIMNYKGGQQLGAFQKGLLVYGGFYPYIEAPGKLKLEIANKKYEDLWSCTEAEVNAYLPKELWPSFLPTKDEQDQLDTFSADIAAYITESRTKFITGALNLDTDWDSYVKKLNDMGADKYLKIKQAQYNRYKAVIGR